MASGLPGTIWEPPGRVLGLKTRALDLKTRVSEFLEFSEFWSFGVLDLKTTGLDLKTRVVDLKTIVLVLKLEF